MKLSNKQRRIIRTVLKYAIRDQEGLIEALKGQWGDHMDADNKRAVREAERDIREFREMLGALDV